jgi:Flp pilus assembly protein CpaB
LEGTPLAMSMLSNEDPKVRAENERKKLEAEKQKKLEEEKAHSFIKKGMRAVTFSIDQRSASSSNMLSPGDLVDVLIMEQRGEKNRTHKYKALKILAIDGVTKFEKKDEKHSDSLLGGVNLGSVGGLLAPKNVTLEVKEDRVETMLKQSSASGVILSLRSQSEPVDENEPDVVEDGGSDSLGDMSLMENILKINKSSAAGALLEEKLRQDEEKAKKEAQEKGLSLLVDSMSAFRNRESELDLNAGTLNKKGKGKGKKKDGSKYEVVSGKVVGDEESEEAEFHTTVIHKKNNQETIKFDGTGRIAVDDEKSFENPSGGGESSHSGK